MKIFGLSGTNGSGKDTLAKLLEEEFGYLNVSATEMLAKELTERGEELSRTNKSSLSAEWRRKHGMGVIVDKAVALFSQNSNKYKGVIVGSLRHPGETQRIHELDGVQLWIDADPAVRYRRITSANRGRGVEDNKTFEEFMADELREMHPEGDGATLNMAAVKENADVFIENNSDDVDEFKNHVRQILKKYL